MSNVFERNINLLKKYQPYLYNKVNAYLNEQYKPMNKQIERILLANHGDIIINMLVISGTKEYLICDHEDPINQAYNWIEKYIDPSYKADIVFGMGFGYHLEVLLTSFKNRKVIVVEPNIELFLQILRVRNIEKIIRRAELIVDESVDFILQKIKALYWDTEEGGIQCEPFEVYGEIFGDMWDELRNKFIKQAQSFNVDIATRRLFGELWAYNNIMNLDKITEASNAFGLVEKFKGVPGILVSAGPSLEKNIHLLKEIKDKCVIMAAGTAVNILEKYELEPHFMVGIDASEGEAAIHRKVKSKDIYFIYSNQVATGSLKSYEGPKFLMDYSADIYTDIFFKRAKIPSNIFLSGPSVANTCFDLLYKMGCNPIVMIGQDLAFTNNSSYAGEAPNEAFEKKDEMLRKGYCTAEDINGNEILTNSGFISMRNWFEGYFEKVKDKVEIINATEGGLKIENARNEKLEDVISAYISDNINIKKLISLEYERSKFKDEILKQLIEYKAFISSELLKLEAFTKNQSKIVDLIKRDIYHPAKNKKAFDRAISDLNKIMELVMGSPIYESLLKNIIEIDFYLIKAEVDRATKELSNYSDVKGIYVSAMEKQNEMLISKIEKLKEFLEDTNETNEKQN